MKFNLENFLELDTTQLLAVNGGSGCGGSSGGGSSGGGASSSSTSSGGGSSGGGSSSYGGGSSSSSSGGGGGGSCGGSSIATNPIVSSVKTGSGGGGGSCSGINTGIPIPNGYDLPSISNEGKKQSGVSIGSEGLTITPKDGVGITIGANVTLGYTPDKGNFDIDADQGTVTVKTPVGTFSAELESVTVKVKVDY